ncbi:MAG: ATP-binding protein [Candidatus Saccharimonadales bacterium]
MSIIFLAYIPALIGIFIITILIFLRRKQSFAVYTLFYLTLIAIVLWLGTQMLSLIVPDNHALAILRISIVFSNLVVPLLLIFTILYRPATFKLSYPTASLIFLPSVLLTLLSTSPDIVSFVHNDGIRQTITTGFLYEVQASYVVLYTLFSLVVLILKARKVKQQRSGILLLVLGLLLPLLVNVLVNYVFKFDASLVQYFLPTSFFGMVSIIAYAMIKHRLFDIKIAIIRSVAYALALLTLSMIYYLLAYVVSITLFKGEVSSTVSLSPINIFLALLLAFIFQPIKSFFDKATDSIFYKDRYNSDEFYARLSEVLTSTTDLRSLLQKAAQEIGETLKAEQAFFYVLYNHIHHISAGTRGHSLLPLEDEKTLTKYMNNEGDRIIVTELLEDNNSIRRLLVSHKIAILMPLMKHGSVLGYLVLGDNLAGKYTSRDIRVLSTVSDELIIAMQNALSVQAVKDINENLEQRIKMATEELKASNAHLRRLDVTKDEFLSMASHQLRTPLTSIKGYLSMVLEGDMGKISINQRKVLAEAFDSSERMVRLIHDFLNVSRLQTGKFAIEQVLYDIVKLVNEEVRTLQSTADNRNITLETDINIDTLELALDETKMRQVVMNFIDNALYYSKEGTIVSIELKKNDGVLTFRVNDTGIGVPESERDQLFTKFYRASNARVHRPDGTGVGLYLAKKVVMAHGGSVLYEPLTGGGSAFGFRLPLADK